MRYIKDEITKSKISLRTAILIASIMVFSIILLAAWISTDFKVRIVDQETFNQQVKKVQIEISNPHDIRVASSDFSYIKCNFKFENRSEGSFKSIGHRIVKVDLAPGEKTTRSYYIRMPKGKSTAFSKAKDIDCFYRIYRGNYKNIQKTLKNLFRKLKNLS